MALATPSGSAAANEVLTNVAAILSLTHEQATQSLPISIAGVVTLAEPTWGGLFFVQDSTGGVFVNNQNPRPAVGDVVQVTGVSHAGAFAPDIYFPKWNKLGTAPLPEAKPVSVERLMSGAEDGNRVEVSGVVRFARKEGELLLLELAAGGYRFRAHPRASTNLVANSLIGATVRVRGTAAASFNRELRQIIGVNLYMPHESDLIIEHLPSTPISELPVGSLRSILQYHRNDSDEMRIRVRGVVTYQRLGEDIFLQDQTDGLQVRYRHTNSFAPGEIVEAVGFPVMERNLPVLQDAILLRTKEPAGRIVSRAASIQELRLGLHHGDMITLKGTLLDRSLRPLRVASPGSNAPVENILTLQCSNYLVSVAAPASKQFAGLAGIPIGSTLEVSGLCLLQVKGTPNPVQGVNLEAVQLLLPDATSVRILQRPSWWTAQRLLAGIGILLAVSLVGISWTMTILRKNFALKASIAEQEELTRELRRSQHYLAEAQKLSQTGSWAWSPEAGIKYWSEECYRVQGFDPIDGPPRFEELFQRIHPDDQPRLKELMQRVVREKIEFETDFRLVLPDGAVRDIHTTGHPVLDPAGNLIEYMGTVIDVTEQHQARVKLEKALAEIKKSEDRLRIIIDTIPTMAWSDRPDGSCEFLSRGWLDYTGLSMEEALNWGWTVAIHSEDAAALKDKWLTAIAAGKPFEAEARFRRADGKYRWCLCRGVPLRDETGNIIQWHGTTTDIEDRKRAEEELRTSESKYRHLVDTTPAFVHTALPSGDLDFFNRGWLEYLGLPITDLLGWRWTAAIHPEDVEELLNQWRASLESGQPLVAESRVRRADGEYRWLLHRKQPQRNEAGEIVKWYGSSIEIEERKRGEALLTAEKGLHEMIATGVALKEILNALCLMIEEQRRGTLASVLLLGPDGIHLESLAGPGLPEGWTRQIASLPIGPCAGSCGTAAYRGSPVIVSDIATDPLWEVADHRASALSYGLRASWSYPILSSEGKVLGTVCLYYREPRSPSPSDLDLIELAVHLARVAIERKESEEQLRRSEAFLAEGQRLSHTGSWGWNASTGKVTWSQEHFRILGLDPQAINPSLDVFWERVHPDNRTGLRRAFDSAIRDKRDFEQEFRIVTPDWSIRHLHGVGHAVLNQTDELVEFIGSTMDITERKRAEERTQSQREAIRLALNAFVEKLDVSRFFKDIIAEIIKQFHPKSWELWLFDEALGELSLQLSSHSADSRDRVADDRNTRRPEEFADVWRSKCIARTPQVFEFPDQNSTPVPQYFEMLRAEGVKRLVLVPLVIGGQNLGFLELHFQSSGKFTTDDLELAQALVNHATLALQLSRLAHRTEQMAVMDERNRMAREIHDTLAQAFAGVVLHSEALGAALGVNKLRSKRALSHIQKLARSGLEEARRSVQALRPRALEGSTLSQALEQMAKRYSEDAKFACDFKQQGAALMLSAEIQNELFRIAQEAMTNVCKHAQAKSVGITLNFRDNQTILTVRDDGIGLAATDSPKPRGGYGLSTMRERAQRIGGQIEITNPTGGGTAIRVLVPLTERKKPQSQTI